VLPATATTATIQNDHGPWVSGSTLDGLDTRKPAKGRTSSEGSGIMADSMAMATPTPR
jgi:hypothetical protein